MMRLLILVHFFIGNIFCINILYMAHIASPSHHIWNSPLAFELAEKGYNVTLVSHDKEKQKHKNLHLILLEDYYETVFGKFPKEFLSEMTILTGISRPYIWAEYCCRHDFKTKGLHTLLNYPKAFKFDLIIFDVTAGQCLYPIIDRFNKPPVIGVTPFQLPPTLSHAWGNPLQTTYSPYFTTTFTNRMVFTERLLNSIYIYSEILYRTYIALPAEEKLAREFFGEEIRPLHEIERNISLLLSNTDPNLIYPLDLPPNIIPVGGMQIKPAKALPLDLKDVVDKSKNGVILFTLGSNMRSDELSLEMRKAILGTFVKLPQTVLWKFETDYLEGCPKNVIIRKWLPQNDILGHPNTKLFISHGGGLGTQEAVYHGVPVVGIPFYFDHIANMDRLIKRKIGRKVDYKNFTINNFYENIKEVLDNPIYTKNVKRLSKRYRDQPQTPLQRAMFWVEYVLRQGGAEHLVLPTRDMRFYQTVGLDILIAFVVAIILIYFALCFLLAIIRIVLVRTHFGSLKKSKTN